MAGVHVKSHLDCLYFTSTTFSFPSSAVHFHFCRRHHHASSSPSPSYFNFSSWSSHVSRSYLSPRERSRKWLGEWKFVIHTSRVYNMCVSFVIDQYGHFEQLWLDINYIMWFLFCMIVLHSLREKLLSERTRCSRTRESSRRHFSQINLCRLFF